MNGPEILSNAYFGTSENSHDFISPLILLRWLITVTGIVEPYLCSWRKLIWSCSITLFTYYYMQFANILLRVWVRVHEGHQPVSFPLHCPCPGLHQGRTGLPLSPACWPYEWVELCPLLLYLLEDIVWYWCHFFLQCLLDSTEDSIWVCCFLWRKFLNYEFNFFNEYKAIRIFSFILCLFLFIEVLINALKRISHEKLCA